MNILYCIILIFTNYFVRLNARIGELQSSLQRSEDKQHFLKQQNVSTSGTAVSCPTVPTAARDEVPNMQSETGALRETDEDGPDSREDRAATGTGTKRRSRSRSSSRGRGRGRDRSSESAQKRSRTAAAPEASYIPPLPSPSSPSPLPPPPLPLPVLSSCCPVCRESPSGLMVCLLLYLQSCFISTATATLPVPSVFQVRCGSCGQGYHSSCSRKSGGRRTADGSFVCKSCGK